MKWNTKRLMAIVLMLLLSAGICAIAESANTIYLPKDLKIIKANTFRNGTSIDKVVVPEGVTQILNKAFAYSSLKEITLPISLTFIAEDAFEGCGMFSVNVPEGCYAYDWCVEHGYIKKPLQITSLKCSHDDTAQIGNTITWTIQTTGGRGTIYNSFNIYLNDVLITSQDSNAQNYISFTPDSAGIYRLDVSSCDAEGMKSSTKTVSINVLEKPVEITEISGSNDIIIPGETITWTVKTTHGQAPILYKYTVFFNENEYAVQDYSDTNSYLCEASSSGYYTLTVECKDALNRITKMSSAPIRVYEEEETIPDAPVLVYEDNSPVFSMQEETAPEYAPATFQLCWTADKHVVSYKLSLDKHINDEWQNILNDEIIAENKYTLKSVLFNNLPQKNCYRLNLTAQGLRAGQTSTYYFCIAPVIEDTSITIDGLSDIAWNHASKFASSRQFTIKSNRAWSVSSVSSQLNRSLVNAVDWITYSYDGNSLIVNIDESNESTVRNAIITLNNGAETATITINQANVEKAPIITAPKKFSDDINNPTLYPVAHFSLEWVKPDSLYTRLRIYELSNDNAANLVYEALTNKNSLPLTAEALGFAFQEGKSYAFELAVVYSDHYKENELENDLLKATYYVKMISDGHYIKINNASSISVKEPESEKFYIEASGIFIWTTDVAWLRVGDYDPTARKGSVSIYADDNTTGSQREGHIYFSCGSATATVNVIQPDSSPKIIYPQNLSKDENNPTELYLYMNAPQPRYIDFICEGDTFVYSSYANNAYGVEHLTYQSPDSETFGAEISSEHVKNTIRTKITVKKGTSSTDYYVTFKNNLSTEYNSFKNLPYEKYNVGAQGDTLTIAVEATTKWKVTSNASWLTATPVTGRKGTTTLTVKVAENATGTLRNGRIILQSTTNDSTSWIEIEQAGTDYLTVYFKNPDTGYEPYDADVHGGIVYSGQEGSTEYFQVFCPGDGQIKCNADWISSSSGQSYYSGKRFDFDLEENLTGSIRSGTVTISYGTFSMDVRIIQAPALGEVSLVSPTLSTSSKNAPVISYDDITLVWKSVKNAVRYTARITNTNLSKYVNDEGTSELSCIIPKEWLVAYETNTLSITAYDQYGHSVRDLFYFTPTPGNAVLINGSLNPVWNNISDMGESCDFVVYSTGNWSASSSQSWITLSKSNGVSGDTLTISVSENTDNNPRSGIITLSVNGTKTSMPINQCAYLSERFPTLKAPQYSQDKAAPTLITMSGTSMSFTWENEPQADFYQLEIESQEANNVARVIASSPILDEGEDSYTFENLTLDKGKLYSVWFFRSCDRWNLTSNRYYFAISDENAWVLADGSTSCLMDVAGSEESERFTITASGYWVAETNDPWILLAEYSIDQERLDKDGDTPSYYNSYSGMSGSKLCISVLANPDGTPRTGTVTISSGGATATITVYQYQNYSIANLISPDSSTTSSDPAEISYGSFTFRWSAGNGGTGRYEFRLDCKNPTWENVIDVDGLTATSYTVPVSKLTEGCEYRLWLGTEIIDGDYAGERYYFRLQYEEQLTPEISVDWSNAKIGGWVEVHGTATGGAGDYSIAYELLCDGIQAGITTWNAESYYQFPITKAGNYQVRLYVKDAQDNQKDILSDSYTVGGNSTASYLNLSQTAWAVDAAGDTLNLQVDSSHNWTYTTSDSWISVSASDNQASIAVSSNTSTQARNGHVLFVTASKSVTLYITQHAMEETDVSSITLSRSVWNLLNPSASMISLSITSSDNWSVSGQPAWIKLSQTSGTGNTTISIYAENNNGGTRSAELVFSISGNAKKLLVTQVGADVAAQVLSVNVSNTSPLTGESVVFTIRTKNADELLYIVDGQLIDSITVIQDTVRYSYTYSLAKEEGREVYFIPRRNGVQGLVSEPLMMNVVSYGTLANTIIQEVRKVNVGDDAYISWTAVPNADSYTVYLYQNDVAVFKKPGIKDTFLTIEHEDLPGVGSYTLLVMATGKGYNQSKSADILKISTPEETFELTEPKSSYTFDVGNRIDIKISNPDGYMLQAQVKKDGKVVALFPSSGPAADKNPIYSFAASEGGEYEFSILAFNAAGSLQWNEGETLVSVNVNGPEFMAGSRIGTGARVMLAENATSFRIVTNTAITKIVVNDGVQDYISEEPVLNTSGAWTHVFTGTMNTPAPGKHIYNVIAYDEYNHTISKQFAIFAAERINKQTLYPQASSVSVLSAPNQGVSATLYPSDKVSVLGQFGDYWYVDFGGTKGVVSKNKLGMTRLTSWDGLTVALLPDTSKTTFYYTQKTPELIVRWKSSVELPDSAYYRLSYIRDIDGEQKVVYSGNNTYAEFSTTSMGYGLLRARVEVVSREDGIVYYTVDEGGGTFVTDSFELYIQLVKPEDYDWYLNGIDSSSETLIKSHLLFTTGYSDDDGEKIGPIDFSSITDGFVTKTYAILFGDAATSTESKYARCGFIAEQIMANCSNVTSSSWFVPFETFEKMIGFIDSADNIDQGVWQLSDIATITKNGQKMVKIDEDTIGHIESIAKVKNSNWYNETFTELKDVASFSQAFFSMIKKYIAYSNVDQTKLDIYIKALDASGNTDLQYIAQLLRDMNSGTDPLLCYLIKSYGFKSLADSLKTGVTNSISSLIDICPHGWAVNTSLKIGTQIGTGINEAVLNINDIQANAYQLKWAVQCADNFMSYFNKIRAKFRSDPMKYYDEFLEACHTFEELIVMEYELFKKIPEALDESLWNRIKNWVSHSDGYKTSIENISVMCDLVDGYVSNWVKNFYNNCLINLE